MTRTGRTFSLAVTLCALAAVASTETYARITRIVIDEKLPFVEPGGAKLPIAYEMVASGKSTLTRVIRPWPRRRG